MTLRGDIDTAIANAGEIITDTRARFLPGLAARFPDVGVAVEGQNRESAETGSSIVGGFLFGLIAVLFTAAGAGRSA